MKTARLLAMATGGLDVGIELEAPRPSTPRGRNGRNVAGSRGSTSVNSAAEQRSHSRSASWSFTRGQVLNPITPITSVIREIVPSLSQISMTASNTTANVSIPESPRPSRTSSRESLLVRGNNSAGTSEDERGREGSGDGRRERLYDGDRTRLSPERWGDSRTLGDSSANMNVHVPRNHNPPGSMTGGGPHQNGNEEQNVGIDIGDGIRWLERNAIFIILLLVKFAWYHRSGE